MWLGLKIFGLTVGVYAGIRLSSVAIDWIRWTIDSLRPPRDR
jgi:hypothetical protein